MARDRFERAFRQAPVGLAFGSAAGDGTYVEVNAGFAAMFGYTSEELSEMTVADITHPLDLDRSNDYLAELRSGRSVRYEKRYVRRDGSVFWGVTHEAVVFDECGAPEVFLVHVADMTEHRRSVDELARRQRQLDESQRRTGIGSFEWISGKEQPLVSDHMYGMLGWDREQPTPTLDEYLAAVHPQDRHLVQTEVLQVLRPGVAEYRYRHGAGHYIRLQTRSEPVFDQDGRPVSVIGTTRDVTRERALEAALREAERYQAAFDVTTYALFLIDADARAMRVVHANAAAGMLLERSPESLEDRPVADVLAGGAAPPGLQALLRGESQRFSGEVQMVRDGGAVSAHVDAFMASKANDGHPLIIVAAREQLSPTGSAGPTTTALSAREREVLEHVAAGRGGIETAAAMNLSPETIKTHLRRIYLKLGVSDRAAAVAVALRSGVLS